MKRVSYLPRYGQTHLDSEMALKAKGPWHLCWMAICTQKRAVLGILGLGGLGVVSMIVASFALSRLVKTIAIQVSAEVPVWSDLTLFLCVYLSLNLLNFLCYIEVTKRQVEMAGPIRQELMLLLYTQILRKKEDAGTSRKASALVMRGARSFTEGTWCVLIDFWPALIGLLVSLPLIFIFSPVLAALTILFSGIFFFYAYRSAKEIYPKASQVAQARSEISRLLNTKLEKVPLTNLFGQKSRELQIIKEGLDRECLVQDVYENPKNRSLNNLLLMSYGFRGIFVAYLLYLAGQGMLEGHFLFFLLLVMQTFSTSSMSAANSFEKLIQSLTQFENAATSIFHFDAPPAAKETFAEHSVEHLVLTDVDYSYQEGRKALDQVNLSISKGQKVAIVGESGSGKSTLFQILSGQFQPNSGRVEANGSNISALAPDVWNRQVAVVPQGVCLFNRSVASNIGYALDRLEQAPIRRSALQANSEDFIRETSEGYNTFMGEGGHRFSGGQRQRISIARAFAKEASLYLLDEPTSTLDPQAERHIFSSINEDFEGKTMVVVTHRLRHIAMFDRVVVMKDGGIIDDGAPAELLERGGHLRELWNAQEVTWSKDDHSTNDIQTSPSQTVGREQNMLEGLFKDGVTDDHVTFDDIQIPRTLKVATPIIRLSVILGVCGIAILAL